MTNLLSLIIIFLIVGAPIASRGNLSGCETALDQAGHQVGPLFQNVEELKEYYSEKVASLFARDADLYCASGGCIKYSQSLLLKLNSLGLRRVTVQGGANVGSKNLFFYHFFLVDDRFGPANEVIIDPTYLQFLDGVDSRKAEYLSAPPIFIGTRFDLEAFFKRHEERIIDLSGTRADKYLHSWVAYTWGLEPKITGISQRDTDILQ